MAGSEDDGSHNGAHLSGPLRTSTSGCETSCTTEPFARHLPHRSKSSHPIHFHLPFSVTPHSACHVVPRRATPRHTAPRRAMSRHILPRRAAPRCDEPRRATHATTPWHASRYAQTRLATRLVPTMGSVSQPSHVMSECSISQPEHPPLAIARRVAAKRGSVDSSTMGRARSRQSLPWDL